MTSAYGKYKELKQLFQHINNNTNHCNNKKGGGIFSSNTENGSSTTQPYNIFENTLDTWVKMVLDRDAYNKEEREKYVVEDKAIHVVEDKAIRVVEDKAIPVVEDKALPVVDNVNTSGSTFTLFDNVNKGVADETTNPVIKEDEYEEVKNPDNIVLKNKYVY